MITYRALLGAAEGVFQTTDRQTLADPGALVDAFVFASVKGHFFDDLANVAGSGQAGLAAAVGPGFLGGDRHSFGQGPGIVGTDLCADAILERGDDFSARGRSE